ncbi:hypothetical protein [Massilia sp. YIM B02443]|nr:hypothetical protein [Massilia sp. YIM B02443]MDN4038823.1 hypothetical protein [Massilia sp. YIM B02443]
MLADMLDPPETATCSRIADDASTLAGRRLAAHDGDDEARADTTGTH